MALLRPYRGKSPRLHGSVFVAETAVVIGDVEIGEDSSVWFGSVLRADIHWIRIGARTNIQDQSMIHVTGGIHPTLVGDDVTVGHRVTLHGCTIKDRCLIGMGATVLDGAVVGEDSLVGAGAVVPPGMIIPPGKLALGAPARVKRDLTPAEIASFPVSANGYVRHARDFLAEGFPGR
jgi:carbonic anhydrase/acetyltransferase-like protein (isoleucine patch superfamily)